MKFEAQERLMHRIIDAMVILHEDGTDPKTVKALHGDKFVGLRNFLVMSQEVGCIKSLKFFSMIA
jgi:hypothetical protein